MSFRLSSGPRILVLALPLAVFGMENLRRMRSKAAAVNNRFFLHTAVFWQGSGNVNVNVNVDVPCLSFWFRQGGIPLRFLAKLSTLSCSRVR